MVGYEQHATKAEAALTRLAGHTSGRSSQLKDVDDDSLLLLTAYTDPSNPWTTSSAAHASLSLLSALPSAKTSRFIVDTVLQRHLRPIFSKTTSKVTSSGRPSQYPEQDARVTEAATRGGIEEPAWKTGSGLTAVSTFAWAVDALEVSSCHSRPSGNMSKCSRHISKERPDQGKLAFIYSCPVDPTRRP